MHITFGLTCMVVFLSIIQLSSSNSDDDADDNTIEKCLRNLVTRELTNSYNYLQLSSKVGTKQAFPGFSSLYMTLSDKDVSKAHDVVKFLVLRQFNVDELFNGNSVDIDDSIMNMTIVHNSLHAAQNLNNLALKNVERCHAVAASVSDANVQDYLESHLLEHHIEIGKLLEDFQQRFNVVSDKELTTHMLDEELLNTYGDYRKDVFS
ncbi:hypothetical protein I4U23_018564 [Adineta vaga]|nr:hypothetical protein I4U23_018564 [Adineta vaga]